VIYGVSLFTTTAVSKYPQAMAKATVRMIIKASIPLPRLGIEELVASNFLLLSKVPFAGNLVLALREGAFPPRFLAAMF
jgi:hypothetical protein